MALKTFVKISAINNLSDARYCAGMGVDMLGFALEPTNPDAISPEKYTEIIGWLSGVQFVGEFEQSSLKQINEILENYPINALQTANDNVLDEIHNKRKKADLEDFIPVIFKLWISPTCDLYDLYGYCEAYEKKANYFLLEHVDKKPNEEFSLDELEQLEKLTARFPIILGSGFNKNNVNDLIDNYKISGISLKGGAEIRAGYKDFDDLAEILEIIEID